MQIQDQHFVVTGGSSGLGQGVATHLIGMGANVSLFDVNEVAGTQTASDLGSCAEFFQCDITSESSVTESLASAVDRFGPINGLINCAGIPGAQRILGKHGTHDLESFSRIVQVNLIGTFNVIRLAAEQMQSNSPGEDGERGVIISTASVAAFDGQIGQAAYAASKAGVASMTLPLARELARFGIRVLTIAPGLFKTPMMDVLPDEVQKSLGESVPFPKRLGQPSEFAQLVQQMIENRLLNGETVRLDGSIRLAAQ